MCHVSRVPRLTILHNPVGEGGDDEVAGGKELELAGDAKEKSSESDSTSRDSMFNQIRGPAKVPRGTSSGSG